MPEKPECYGAMFPDLTRLEYNRPCRGKAFAALATSHGIGVQSWDLAVDEAGWDACQQCPVYRSCYDLCSALLALKSAMSLV